MVLHQMGDRDIQKAIRSTEVYSIKKWNKRCNWVPRNRPDVTSDWYWRGKLSTFSSLFVRQLVDFKGHGRTNYTLPSFAVFVRP